MPFFLLENTVSFPQVVFLPFFYPWSRKNHESPVQWFLSFTSADIRRDLSLGNSHKMSISHPIHVFWIFTAENKQNKETKKQKIKYSFLTLSCPCITLNLCTFSFSNTLLLFFSCSTMWKALLRHPPLESPP